MGTVSAEVPVRRAREQALVDGTAYAKGAAWLCAFAITLLPLLTPSATAVNLTVVDVGIALAIGGCFWWAMSTRARLKAPYALPVALTAIGGTLAAMRSVYPLVGGSAVMQDLFLLAWAIALANLARSRETLLVITGAWCYTAFFWAAALVLAVAGGQTGVSGATHATGGRAPFTFGDENTGALYYAISLFVVLACRRPHNKVLRGVTVATILLAILFTGSLAGILGLLGAAVAISVAVAWQRHGFEHAVVVLCVAMLVATTGLLLYRTSDLGRQASASQYAAIRYTIGRTDWSAGEREVLARETSNLYRSGDLFGIGPASTKRTLYALQAPYVREAHNDWTAALLERGLLGALGAVALFVVVGFYGIAVGMRPLREPFNSLVPAPWFLIGTLSVLLVFSVTHEALHDRTVWTLLGLLAALHLWARMEPVSRRPIAEGSAA
jgi:O-antigen ligase